MKTHETPEGICFADAESESNYQKAMNDEKGLKGFRPMIVIVGDSPGVGKTRLARHILGHHQKGEAACSIPVKEVDWGKLLPASLGVGYLFLDNYYGHLHSQTLSAFLSSSQWSWRKLGTTEMVSAPVNVMVVLTCSGDLTMSESLIRRSIVIRLTVRRESAVAVGPDETLVADNNDELDDDHPLWCVNAQIKGLLEGEGASEDHRDVIAFFRGIGLPEGTAKRIHRAIVCGDSKVLPADVAESRADTNRLDWLEQNPLKAEVHGGADDGHVGKAWAVSSASMNLRDTLDTLMGNFAFGSSDPKCGQCGRVIMAGEKAAGKCFCGSAI